MSDTHTTDARSENITRSEAAERSRLISVTSYEVVLDVTSTGPTFTTDTTAVFACTSPGSSTWIDLIAPEIPVKAYTALSIRWIKKRIYTPSLSQPMLAECMRALSSLI